MAAEYGNIDDFLSSGKTSLQPETPEHQPEIKEDDYNESPSYEEETKHNNDENLDNDSTNENNKHDSERDEQEPREPEKQLDEFGNEKAPPRTYTQDEVNEMFRKRFKNHAPQQSTEQIQQQANEAARGFEYNENSDVPWQQQLEHFVEQTFHKISQKEQQKQIQARENAAENEFRERFTTGMERFNDFKEVVEVQPVTQYMTMALRGMKDPTAFIYAASKRAPTELQRISQIHDPYAQIVEMGKLEERMRKSPTKTNAPKPVARTRDDGKMSMQTEKKGESIEDLIARAESKKRAQNNQRRGR